jgi:hypothetical protein
MIKRQHMVRDFFGEAEVMREALDERFRDVYTNSTYWEYFCDPRMYTYLRTAPQEMIPTAVFERFMQRLRLWCMENLGLIPMSEPYLHLMVNGCKLGLHSDFHNGAWGYVYSLTRWENRKFSGGETLLLRDGVPSYKKHHVHGEVLYELIPAHFNQLLVFDDRIVHGTPTIEGSMDPLDGRIVLVGHIRATSPVVSGSLRWGEARRVVLAALPHLRDRIRSYKDVQGTITYRLEIGATGTVESVTILTDNVVTPFTGYDHSDAVASVKSITQQTIAGLKFPPAAGKSAVIVPVLIPLPDLHPIEFAVSHDSSRDAIHEWVATRLGQGDALELQGSWEADTFVVREPIAGSIRIGPRQIVGSFDPPMWVPSQRERFQAALKEWAKTASASSAQR